MTGLLGIFQGRFGRVTLFRTDQPVCEHAHPQVHVLIKIDGQDGAYDVAGHGPSLITDDRLVVLNPWLAHANRRAAGGEPATILALYVEASWLNLGSGSLPIKVFAAPEGRMTGTIRRLATRVSLALCDGPQVGADATETLLYELMMEILAEFADGARLPVPERAPDHRIRNAIGLMRRRAGCLAGANAVARAVGLSRSHFYERFRASVGLPPGLYADGLRLEAAIDTLIRTDRRLGEISLDLGFPAQSHFSRFFKTKVGFSPKDYRRVAGSAAVASSRLP
jgi:AraC family transcriptional regulator